MVGHLGVFVKVLYFVQAFISKVGLRNVLGTISEFSVRSQESGSFGFVTLSQNIFSVGKLRLKGERRGGAG